MKYLIFILPLFISCTNKSKFSIPNIVLQPDYSVNNISESIIIPDIEELSSNGDKIIFYSDNDELFIVDTLFNLISSPYPIKGKGPDEILNPVSVGFNGSSAIILDASTRKVNLYSIDNNEYKSYDFTGIGMFINRASFKDSKVIFSSTYYDHPIHIYDFKENSIYSFGKFFDYDNDDNRKWAINQRHLLFGDNEEIISISSYFSIIERYNVKGELLSRTELKNKNVFDPNTVPFTEEDYNSPENYHVGLEHVSDACYTNGKLYLLLRTRINERPYCNEIIVLEDKNNEFIPTAKYILKSKNNENLYLTTFSVENQNIYAFDHEAFQLVKFNLN